MRRFAVGCFALIGLVAVLITGTTGAGVWYYWRHQDQAAVSFDKPVIAAIDLRGRITEERKGRWPLARFADAAPTILETVALIDRLAADDRVVALFARLDNTAHGWASAQELRQAIARFSAAGKATIAFATSFGELSPANEGYFIATAFDRIEVQPGGLIGLTGLSISQPSARGLLELIGVSPEVIKRSEYKTALDTISEFEMTPSNREMLNGLLTSFERALVDAISSGRELPGTQIRELIDRGPFSAEQALDSGLIDDVNYYHAAIEAAENDLNAILINADEFNVQDHDIISDKSLKIALIVASGMIYQGDGLPGDGIASDRLSENLASVIGEPDIDGIILRLDSGGGSAVASEAIARQLERAKTANIPVVVSMSNTAASGGYWIAQAASRIIAHPMTVTGSIGVILAKPSLEKLWSKLQVNWSELSTGGHAGMWSINRTFTASERAHLESLVEILYDSFKTKVATSRNLTMEAVEQLARGRVWTGEQALELGLVDRLGGIDTAIEEMANLASTDPARLVLLHYPPPPTPFDQLKALLTGEFDPGFELRMWWRSIEARTLALNPVAIAPIKIR